MLKFSNKLYRQFSSVLSSGVFSVPLQLLPFAGRLNAHPSMCSITLILLRTSFPQRKLSSAATLRLARVDCFWLPASYARPKMSRDIAFRVLLEFRTTRFSFGASKKQKSNQCCLSSPREHLLMTCDRCTVFAKHLVIWKSTNIVPITFCSIYVSCQSIQIFKIPFWAHTPDDKRTGKKQCTPARCERRFYLQLRNIRHSIRALIFRVNSSTVHGVRYPF